nr:serine decarboxylase [Tanacetum cinerariifolium]
MAGSIDVILNYLNIVIVESLPEDFDPATSINDLLPPVTNDVKLVNRIKKPREIVLGRNVCASCLEVAKPDADDEVTDECEAYMASVLATYQKSLLEITKHHLVGMYRMDCEKVNTLISEEIDCKDFKAKVSLHKDKLAIINVNIGTIMKGAVDDLDLVIKTLKEFGFLHDRFYIHCDGALFGLMMPFIKLQMAGSIDVMLNYLNIVIVESLPEDFDPATSINDLLPPVTNDVKLVNRIKKPREIVLGRNVCASCLEVTKPDADDEVTGECEAYMASVLATYQKSLLEITKHHLGNNFLHLSWLIVMREVFPDGILYASSESHYSIFKAVGMYRMDCEKVNTLISEEIDCKDFKAKVSLHKDKPAIINVNIGTIMKGAVDDLDLVIKTLEEFGFSHDRFYIHCDGALFGLMMPFIKLALRGIAHKPQSMLDKDWIELDEKALATIQLFLTREVLWKVIHETIAAGFFTCFLQTLKEIRLYGNHEILSFDDVKSALLSKQKYDDDVDPECSEGGLQEAKVLTKKLGHIVSDCYKLKNKVKRECKGNNKRKPEKAADVAIAKGDSDGDVLLKNRDFSHDRFYIHCDGALFGLMMPFVKLAPKLSFKKPIGSVSVSGHKFIECPMPCGVKITRLKHINALSRNVEYLASRDATIMGSRNGHAPLFLWYALSRKEAEFGAMLNELSSTVVFERPQDEKFTRKWQLACQGNITHVVVKPNINIHKLDDFVNELIERCKVCYENEKLKSPCVASQIGSSYCLCALHK